MKRVIRTSSGDFKAYYLISVGSGLYWQYLYILEVDEPTTDTGYLIDELIDYLAKNAPERLIDTSSNTEYAWGTDENGYSCLVEKDNPKEIAFHYDEFVVGDNPNKVLLHYGQLSVREISPEDAETFIENTDTILIEVR